MVEEEKNVVLDDVEECGGKRSRGNKEVKEVQE